VVSLGEPGGGEELRARALSNLNGVQESLVRVFLSVQLAHSTLPGGLGVVGDVKSPVDV
jgi:hypothetical protein